MATRTSVGSGLWSAAGTWDTGVPADDDLVVIAAGHTVEFNVDTSGFANGIQRITINGTLKLTRTAGTYYLKMKAACYITGAGTFDCGASAGDAIPFAAKHTITGGAGWYIQGSGGLTLTVFAAEPAIKTVLLTQNEAIGATVMHVDTSVLGDIWADGDTIRIDDLGSRETEERIIAAGGIAAGTITVTAGLTAAKYAGALVHLVTRNVQFIRNAAHLFPNFTDGKLIIAGGSFLYGGGTAYITNISPALISGGVFTGGTYHLYNSIGNRISGGVFSGANYAMGGNCIGSVITGGTFSGMSNAIYSSQAVSIFGGLFTGNNYGIETCNALIKNAIFRNNTRDIGNSVVTAFNAMFASAIENSGYTALAKEIYSESINHDQVPGKFTAWTKGGATASVASPVPSGYSSANQITLADANNEGFWQKEITVGAGASLNITMNLRKSASMAYLPRCIIFNKAETDPFAGGAGIHTFTMTDSIDTFEEEIYTYYNATANDITLVIRFQGKNASGTVTTTLLVEQINVDLTSALAQLALIKAKTDNLPADPADESLIEAAISAIPPAPTAVQNRQEMDANSTRLSAIDGKTTNLPTDPADESLLEAAIAAIPSAPSTTDIMNTVVEGAYTLKEVLRIMAGVLAGKLNGGGTGTLTFRDLSDSLNRVVADVDLTTGDRDSITLDVS